MALTMPDSSPVSSAPLAAWMSAVLVQIEQELEHILPDGDAVAPRLHAAMRYAVLGGGKRVRGLLVFAAGEVTGAAPAHLARVAGAVELIHAYSLVHDDLPCMDDDVLRRGKPTVHVKFDAATALLAGDALQTLAFESLAAFEGPAVLAMVRRLAQASGSRGMAGGQAIDLDSVGRRLERSELEQMHRLKTGALLGAAVMLGAWAGREVTSEVGHCLEQYATAVGLAFQVVDDILDVETDTATLGKTAGKDAQQHKPTYVSLLGLGPSKTLAAQLRDEARAALAPLGAAGARLDALADFIVLRKS